MTSAQHIDLTQIPDKPGGRLDLPDPEQLHAAENASGGKVDTHSIAPAPSPYVRDEETAPVEEPSDLDLLKRDLATKVGDTITLKVDGRPGYAVRFAADISHTELKNWRSRARGKREVDVMKVDCLIIANKAQAIVREGRDLTDTEGNPLNFQHKEFLDILGVRTAADAVKQFYGLDGHIDSTANSVLAAAGWGQETEDESPDPTSGD